MIDHSEEEYGLTVLSCNEQDWPAKSIRNLVTAGVQLVIDAPRKLHIVGGELLLKIGNSDDSARLPPREPGTQRPGDLD